MDVLLGSLYYDAFRQLIGCTAFACDGPDGPMHARNLDWWTEDQMLARLTCIVRAHGGRAIGPYQMVSWPGFIGALSGLAREVLGDPERGDQQRAALTCRARRARAPAGARGCNFGEAMRAFLERTPIAADCLLFVTGTRQGEMAVIERTSTRAAVRGPEHGFVAVTNDYRSLDAVARATAGNRLQETACGRFDRAVELCAKIFRRISPLPAILRIRQCGCQSPSSKWNGSTDRRARRRDSGGTMKVVTLREVDSGRVFDRDATRVAMELPGGWPDESVSPWRATTGCDPIGSRPLDSAVTHTAVGAILPTASAV